MDILKSKILPTRTSAQCLHPTTPDPPSQAEHQKGLRALRVPQQRPQGERQTNTQMKYKTYLFMCL